MTLRFIDGFEGYTNASIGKFWDYVDRGTNDGISDTLGRRGGSCYNVPGASFTSSTLRKYFSGIVNDYCIFGHAFYFNGGTTMSIKLWSGSEPQFQVNVVSNQLTFKNTPNTTPSNVYISAALIPGTWYYLEFKVNVKQSDGKYIVRLNEQELFDWTGDTYGWSAIGYISGIEVSIGAYTNIRWDDFYVCNGQGSVNNDFLGDVRVDAIFPNGAGNYSQLTPSAGSNYQCVDDDPYDDSDYVEGANLGEIDSYTYGSVPVGLDDTAIYGVQLNNQAKRTATADNVKIKGLIRTGSTDYKETTGQSLNDSFKSNRTIWEDDPSDSNIWTQSKINACEFGMEVA